MWFVLCDVDCAVMWFVLCDVDCAVMWFVLCAIGCASRHNNSIQDSLDYSAFGTSR